MTSLRFFAAFWVFLFHLSLRIELADGWVLSVIRNGARAVDFFFILSGFVILHVYGDQIAAHRFSIRRFMVKRLARIYPLHLTLLLVFALLAWAGARPAEGLWASLLLLHSFATTDGLVLNGPSWTISAEMFAYLLFALAGPRLRGLLPLCLAFGVSAVLAHLLAVALGASAFLHLTWDFGALRIVPLFLLGMILRLIAPHVSGAVSAVLFVLGLAMLFGLTCDATAGYPVLLAFAMLILGGAGLSSRRACPTNSALLVYLGEISYAIYMVHLLLIWVCLDFLPKLGIPVPSWPLVTLALLLVSSASYHLLEKPARRWIVRRFA
ncbi:acyltransferase family protein [Salipiger abyssi]|uniref:acyltransferase family protein n=1 Tax=Salipiger abyssi TaxID=1250539 RepID=UPI001A90171F|nr:acyltransferase [Salipiger abyssi]MBN9888485.1 acyltransferase [Salipiger abyssi]